ncbi:predicted protein [Postia placenta Mad-698-R]|uniref:F-box domain-containing protein n=1 Tax=Postia placenta MAD-698-R-SB12 TaxID=670580 RepID=A0A1X6MLU5_9APHY|nr:hypothetical protein POSPLADRAFT_1156726 [Postia placenta MAD-698-R-SB12]EED82797.1 predicted protein [Postia placenta Mad-698-R]OSX57374.1 hypothetical protein POSPLADRAFT_1156726 [Postia placenta MAD-698-R-SB12]
MSVLWETMAGLAPFIRTLPPNHVYDYEDDKYDDYESDDPGYHKSTFVIGVNRHHLASNVRFALNTQRLDHYARFIKHVTVHDKDAYYATLHDLSIHMPSGYRLLPEVRTLDIHLDAVGGPEGMDMLFGPRVDAISVRIERTDTGFRWTTVFLNKMFAICRNLRTLKIDFDLCDPEEICVILDMMRAARPSLRALHLTFKAWIYGFKVMGTPRDSMERLLRVISGTVHDFSSTIRIEPLAMQAFGLFRNLQNLMIHLSPQAMSHLTSKGPNFLFPSLRSLEIIADNIFLDTPPFMRHLQAMHLDTLALLFIRSPSASCEDFMSDFNQSFLTCSFSGTLSVVAMHPRQRDRNMWRPPYSMMATLLALPKLSALYLPRQWARDDVLETIAKNRPEIQLLEHCPLHPRAFPDIPDVPLFHSQLL